MSDDCPHRPLMSPEEAWAKLRALSVGRGPVKDLFANRSGPLDWAWPRALARPLGLELPVEYGREALRFAAHVYQGLEEPLAAEPPWLTVDDFLRQRADHLEFVGRKEAAR